jgi:hypothetical protein
MSEELTCQTTLLHIPDHSHYCEYPTSHVNPVSQLFISQEALCSFSPSTQQTIVRVQQIQLPFKFLIYLDHTHVLTPIVILSSVPTSGFHMYVAVVTGLVLQPLPITM